jgi:hypothetical protein
MLCLLSRRPGEREFAISFPAETQPIRSDYRPASRLSRSGRRCALELAGAVGAGEPHGQAVAVRSARLNRQS